PSPHDTLLPLHDALPISGQQNDAAHDVVYVSIGDIDPAVAGDIEPDLVEIDLSELRQTVALHRAVRFDAFNAARRRRPRAFTRRSEEHTSELQSPDHLVC